MIRNEMRRMVVLAALALMVTVALPALAAKPAAVTGDIELMPAAQARVAADGAAGPTYGGYAEFVTDVNGKMASNSTLYVTVVCRQGSEVVYQWSAAPNFAFPLHDQPGQGLEWNGGDADCSASLIYKIEKGRKYTLTTLDTALFTVAGS